MYRKAYCRADRLIKTGRDHDWVIMRFNDAFLLAQAVIAANDIARWRAGWREQAKSLPVIKAVKAVRVATGWSLRRCLATVKYLNR
jgi:hypothetical protein